MSSINQNYLGQIRDTYDELMAKKQAEKAAKTAALKQKLILVILVLIVIIGANVGFIYMRWKGEREKEPSEILQVRSRLTRDRNQFR